MVNNYLYTKAIPPNQCYYPDIKVSDSYEVAIGNRALMLEESIVVEAPTEAKMREHENSGHTAVLMAIDGEQIVKFVSLKL